MAALEVPLHPVLLLFAYGVQRSEFRIPASAFLCESEEIEINSRGGRDGFGQGYIRPGRRCQTIADRVVATGSLVQRKVGGSRNGEIAMLDFLASPKITVASIMEADVELTAAAARGRCAVAPQ